MRILQLGVLVTLLALLTGCPVAIIGGAAATGAVVAQERSTGHAIDDTSIFWQIKHHFVQSPYKDLVTGVSVEVIEGRVHLTGYVTMPEVQIEAVRLAWLPNGVTEVVNEIQVKDSYGLGNKVNNQWIRSQVASRIVLEKGVRSLNYSVEVVDGVVYLMGIAQSNEELDKVTTIASRVKGVKKVISHVRLRDAPAVPVSSEPIEGHSFNESSTSSGFRSSADDLPSATSNEGTYPVRSDDSIYSSDVPSYAPGGGE